MTFIKRTKNNFTKLCGKLIHKKQSEKKIKDEKIEKLVDEAFSIYGKAIKKLGNY